MRICQGTEESDRSITIKGRVDSKGSHRGIFPNNVHCWQYDNNVVLSDQLQPDYFLLIWTPR